ncbi:hypothetical protein GCM10027443_29670 [Pontibacter brevis]
MATALTLTGIILLVCTLCSAFVLLLSNKEEPDRGYGWVRKPDAASCPAPILRLVPGGNAESAPRHQHIAMETAAEGSRVELIA